MNACPKCGKFHEKRSNPRIGLPFDYATDSVFGAKKPKRRRALTRKQELVSIRVARATDRTRRMIAHSIGSHGRKATRAECVDFFSQGINGGLDMNQGWPAFEECALCAEKETPWSPFLAAQILAASPAPPATATPVIKAETGQNRTLAGVARERKLGIKGVKRGTLSVAGTSGAALLAGVSSDKAATAADARLAKAVRDGEWVDQNIHYHEGIKEQARREWDAAAENCRKTPGCTPSYREPVEFGGVKPLRTGDEVLHDRTPKNDSVEPLGKWALSGKMQKLNQVIPGEIYHTEGWWRSHDSKRYGPYATREEAEKGTPWREVSGT